MPHPRNFVSDSDSPQIMGILNATPDSFSDGGNYINVSRALDRISIMIKEGAQIIDVGGESTRPGAEPVSVKEELKRIEPILDAAIPIFKKTIFSIDTTKYKVAEKALKLGAKIVNDVSGMQKEPRLADLCAQHDAGFVIMHSKGNPETMQQNPHYTDVVDDVRFFFEDKIKEATSRGAKNIILDPGIGFGKTVEHNLKLIAHLDLFREFGFPILVGVSRKSLIDKILGGRTVDERLVGSIATQYHALIKGASMLRVHDVKEASDSICIFNAIQSQI